VITSVHVVPSAANPLRDVGDHDLLFQIQMAVRGERAMTIKVLHHLNEIHRRKLFLELGYSSLFDYCIRKLKYSPSATGRRIQAARCIRRYPEVLTLLRERQLSLSAISLIEPVLTDQNRGDILERVCGKSHRAVERIVSEYREPVAYRDSVRPVGVQAPESVDADVALFERALARLAPQAVGVDGGTPSATAAGGRGTPDTAVDNGTPGAGSAATEQKFLVRFVASEELMARFEEAKALLSHRCKDGTFAGVLGILLEEFLEKHSPEARHRRRQARNKKAAAGPTAKQKTHSRRRECENRRSQRRVSENRKSTSTNPTRHIPAAVRDEVFVRDEGRCSFIARDGTRCRSKRSLQVDHIRPFAAGGSHEPSNLRLLCALHNHLAAERTLGKHVMKRYWRQE
jgi:5-methylcytosine-specific restriction endonuclease McrA